MDKAKKKKLRKQYEQLEEDKLSALAIELSDAKELIDFVHSTNEDILRLMNFLKGKYPKEVYLPFTKALSKVLIYTSEVQINAEQSRDNY